MGKTPRGLSKAQEREVARAFRGRVTAASGALWGMKGDVRSPAALVECKATMGEHYALSWGTWEKIRGEAARDHMRVPVVVVSVRGFDMAVAAQGDFPYQYPAPEPRRMSGEFRVRPSLLDGGGPVAFQLGREGRVENLALWRLKDFLEMFADLLGLPEE